MSVGAGSVHTAQFPALETHRASVHQMAPMRTKRKPPSDLVQIIVTIIALIILAIGFLGCGLEPQALSDGALPVDAWQCYDDDSLLCDAVSTSFYRCAGHRWQGLSDADCARISADPRRPELRTYPGFCDRDPAGGWRTCAKPWTDWTCHGVLCPEGYSCRRGTGLCYGDP